MIPVEDIELEMSAIQADKTKTALSIAEIRSIDQKLSREWDVDFFPQGSDLFDILSSSPDQAAVARFHAVHDQIAERIRAGRCVANQHDGAIYEAIAQASVFGPVTSQRRADIIDAAALSIGIYRALGMSGAVLDIGCNAGFVTNIVADALDTEVVGIDPSEAAIEYGRKTGALSTKANLLKAKIPWSTAERFQLVISVNSMPDSPAGSGPFIKEIGGLLTEGGVALIVSPFFVGADVVALRRILARSRLGFGFADVVGGYGGIPPRFEATGVVAFVKGSSRELPRKFRELMESEWDQFRDYANRPGTEAREKTQAFERARRSAKVVEDGPARLEALFK